MNEQTNANDGAAPTDATKSSADGPPAAACGGEQQAFVPSGVFDAGIGGRRVLWPVAIGAASVVVAALKLLTLIGDFLQLGVSVVLGSGPPFSEVFGGSLWSMAAATAYLLGGVIGALLLPAGILVWRQSRLGPGMHKAYAIIAILLNLALPLTQFFAYPEMYRMQLISRSLWSATLGMVYPVFLLVWFSRAKVKAETRLWR